MGTIPEKLRMMTPNEVRALHAAAQPVLVPTAEEHFLLSVIFLPSDRLGALSNALMDEACLNDSASARDELSRKLMVLDAIGELKFPGRWISLRRGAA